MKGILMFDNLNDVVFFDVDSELSQHIQKLAVNDGLLDTVSSNEERNIDKNVIMQLFSPLIASYKVMQSQFGNRYKYIESEDGVLLVFDEVLNYVVVCICHQEDNLEDIQKEISLFLLVLEMFFGPSLHMLKSEIICSHGGVSRSDLITQIVDKWRSLKMEQQMFLVEALERLIINPDITAMCVDLLQTVLEKVRLTHKDGTYLHAFALVDTKLLALYSCRNSGQLPKETLLLLILIIQVLKTPTVVDKCEEAGYPISDDEFFIPKSSSTTKANVKKENIKKSNSNGQQEEKYKSGAHSSLIYLKSRSGQLVPHILYVVEVTSRISISILCELTSQGVISGYIASLVKQLNNLMRHPLTRHSIGSFDDLEKQFKTLTDLIWKLKGTAVKEKLVKRLISKWDQLKESELDSFFKVSKEKITNPRLESGISSCCDLLTSIFEEVIALPCLSKQEKSQTPEHQEVFKSVQKLSMKRLNDVADFLEVKAFQNITMASYITKYPGLIHFIYVNRNSDCLIAPTITLRKTHLNGTPSLKRKIWKMVKTGRKYIDGANNLCSLWKDEDLNFFYNVWFEDSSGRIIKPTILPNLKYLPKKGILCGNFYKKLVKECFPNASYDHIFCYEFFCAHLTTTPTEDILEQSKQLCAELWHFSGAYRTSLDLL